MEQALTKPKRKPAGRRNSKASRPQGVTKPAEPETSRAYCPPPDELDKSVPLLRHLGGSKHDAWNQALCNQVINAARYGKDDTQEERSKQYFANMAFLAGVKPTDVIEGMMAAQLFASHAAAMDCYRRAMLPGQTDYGREMNLTHAAKLTRANAAQVEALAKHRNKGQQKVIVEHVHVYQGGQAAFIANATPVEGVAKLNRGQPHAIGHATGAPMRCEDSQRKALPVASDAERTLQDARGTLAGSA
jgi:hypothetical protein